MCNHPKAATLACYGGIDRVYKDGCDFKTAEKLDNIEDVPAGDREYHKRRK